MQRLLKSEKVLVTGVADVNGLHMARRLLLESCYVVGVDNSSDYEEPTLNKDRMSRLFDESDYQYLLHLAAQAGVRYSLKNPHVLCGE